MASWTSQFVIYWHVHCMVVTQRLPTVKDSTSAATAATIRIHKLSSMRLAVPIDGCAYANGSDLE